MDDPTEPGSPLSLRLFHRWCRAQVVLTIMRGEVPELLFADGPRQPKPFWAFWEVTGVPPSTHEFIVKTLPSLAGEFAASQVGICIPFGGEQPGALLLTVDETGAIAEQAFADIDDDGRAVTLHQWVDVGTDLFPVADWQGLLAIHAGYENFTKWRCNGCESVCPGEAAEAPTRCDFCGSSDVDDVGVSLPLAPPRPPFDAEYVSDEDELMASPFVQMLRETIKREAA